MGTPIGENETARHYTPTSIEVEQFGPILFALPPDTMSLLTSAAFARTLAKA